MSDIDEIIRSLNKESIARLKKLLPKEAKTVPKRLVEIKTVYPAILKKHLGDLEVLNAVSTRLLWYVDPDLSGVVEEISKISLPLKVQSSPTMNGYRRSLATTRRLLCLARAREDSGEDVPIVFEDEEIDFLYRTVLDSDELSGIPEYKSEKAVYTVVTTTTLKKEWLYQVLRLFALSVVSEETEYAHLVLPLHSIIESYPLRQWSTRKAFRDAIVELAGGRAAQIKSVQQMREIKIGYRIGGHVELTGGLRGTAVKLYPGIPAQIFLGNNKGYRVNISDTDLALMSSAVAEKGIPLYVHSPYAINLCNVLEDNAHLECLQKYLRYSAAIGARGVVVHVGKYTDRDPEVALEIAKSNVRSVLEYASNECPLLLETPAGQGTETLTTVEEFADFVGEIDDPRFGICVDTCHVWSTGILPSEYLEDLASRDLHPRLIHYNDSSREFGCCVDRHEALGKGCIGVDELRKCAEYGRRHNIHMLQE